MTDTPARSDPLLTAAKLLATLFMVVLAIIALAMPVAIAAIHLYPERVLEELGPNAGQLPGLTWALTLLLLGFLCFALLGMAFLRHLKQMIDTVGAGDPFVAANAARLSRMGWIILAGQAIALPLEGISTWLRRMLTVDRFDLEIDISLEAILLAILLFILARVFRQGAAMRDDLEGTV